MLIFAGIVNLAVFNRNVFSSVRFVGLFLKKKKQVYVLAALMYIISCVRVSTSYIYIYLVCRNCSFLETFVTTYHLSRISRTLNLA